MSDAKGMSFRARMNNLAKSYGLRPQTVIQNYMFERFLERLEKSVWSFSHLTLGVVAIFFYVGCEVCIGANINLYASESQ